MYIFDLHCDTIYECLHKQQELFKNNLCVSLEKGTHFDRWVQTFALFIHDKYNGRIAREEFNKQYALLKSEIKHNGLNIFKGEVKSGCNVLISIENAAFIGDDFELIKNLAKEGVQLATLTWNDENVYAGGAHSDCGLTSLGKQAAKRMDNLGITLDVSHLSDKSFYELFDTVDSPMIASHSNARAVCNQKRNLTDDMLKRIAERGGIVGLNFYTDFLSNETPQMSDILRHAEHIINLCGENILSLGSDFDGADMPFDLKTQEDIEKLYQLMVQYFGKSLVGRIFYQNAYDFFTKKLNDQGYKR